MAPAAGTDYTLTVSDKWKRGGDGFYYYPSAVAPKGTTMPLLTGVPELNVTPPTGYSLNVEIIASGIQSEPPAVVVQAWGNAQNNLAVNNGTLSVTGG